LLLVMALIAAPGSRAAGEPGTDASELERQRQQDHNAQLAMALDPAAANTEQLIAAVTSLDQQIRSQLARTVEAERSQHDAERRLAENKDELARMQPDLREVTNKLQAQAVRLYSNPEESDNSLRLMRAEYYDDAELRRVFDDAINGDSRELIEAVRRMRNRHDNLQNEAVQARDEAATRQHERETLYQEVLAGQSKLKTLQTEWDKRLAGQGKSSDNIGDTSDLDAAIAAQKAKLPAAAPVASSNGRMIRPVGGKVNDPFGYLASRGRMHEGVDLQASTGTPVAAAASGRVIHSGWEGAYGYSVVIDHGGGLQTRYAHNSKLNVSVGSNVSQGQIIALSGATGDVTGPHVHFEVIRNGVRVNPANYIPL
jgi:murein DD-endopeptidase MepM/ murein hydrolase activator NlpD